MTACDIQKYSSFELCPLSNDLKQNIQKLTLLPSSGDMEWKLHLFWWKPKAELLSPISPMTEGSPLSGVHHSMCISHSRMEAEQHFKHSA
jgi:hypothetical protein